MLAGFGYVQQGAGKTSGTRLRFMHKKLPLIILHKPHPAKKFKAVSDRPKMPNCLRWYFCASPDLCSAKIDFIRRMVCMFFTSFNAP